MKLDIQGIFAAIRKFQDAIQSHIPFRIQHLHDQFDLMVRISIQSHEMMRQQMEDQANQTHDQMNQNQQNSEYVNHMTISE